ncbi:hypothetical protein EFY79_15010 [Hanamia caeni]|jgi:hypothetical protein|uniref:Uncharacterized protein n=1 Tax=Hanamia caeni TaxID=2294116 RepID=A0A3M9N9L1_9BACT|nr:hypothetical protein [Hanamia caeni]RNI34490.1 hypothetical protein EFY79_15010 [Hanamia caeni]
MKIMYKLAAISVLMMLSYCSYSQPAPGKHNYFYKYASRLQTPDEELSKAFAVTEGSKVKLNFGGFAFNGIVTSSIKRYDSLHTVIVKSAALDNTILAISRRINSDKSIIYVGRLINNNSADGYQLKKEDNGAYAMHKIQTDALIEDF